jgi:hypothetical protein
MMPTMEAVTIPDTRHSRHPTLTPADAWVSEGQDEVSEKCEKGVGCTGRDFAEALACYESLEEMEKRCAMNRSEAYRGLKKQVSTFQ